MTTTLLPDAASFYDADFSGQDLAQVQLTDREFIDCNFTGCNLRAANLDYSVFRNCQFNDTASEHAADLSQASLRETLFSHCNLTVVDFIRCKGYDLTFEHCQLQGADLSKSDFRMPIANAELAALSLKDCNFSYGNLSNNYLVGCALTDSRLIEVCLDYCDLSDADLSGCELHNISAVGVTIRGADLRGASFNNLNPREIDLTGVRMLASQVGALLEPLGIIVEDEPG